MKNFYPKEAIEGLVELAEQDPDYAALVVRIFIETVENKSVPDNSILEFISSYFEKILSGEKPNKVIKLIKQGAPKKDEKKYYLIAARLIDSLNLNIYANETVAISEAAERECKSKERIYQIYKQYEPIITDRFEYEQKLATAFNTQPPKSAVDLVEYWIFEKMIEC